MSPARVRRLAWGTLAFILPVIVWGAFVRATGSGAGCGKHWPLCNGVIVPQSPRTATLIELFHRVTSGLTLVPSIALLVVAWRADGRRHRVTLGAMAVLLLLLAEALVGRALVLFGLVGMDDSLARALVMAGHLVNTFFLLGAAALTADWASGTAAPRFAGQGAWAGLLAVALVLATLLGASGAMVALGDTLFPARSLAQGMVQDLSPTAHFLVRLRAIHPVLAFVTAGMAATAGLTAAVVRPSIEVRRRGFVLALFFACQLAAGLFNLVLLAPVWMQLVHLLLADLCFIALVRLGSAALAADAPGLVAAPLPTA